MVDKIGFDLDISRGSEAAARGMFYAMMQVQAKRPGRALKLDKLDITDSRASVTFTVSE